MKNSKSVSSLALLAVVFVAWACSCPRLFNTNNSNNSNIKNSNNANTADNANRITAGSDFITKFSVSNRSSGEPATSSFATSDKIYVVFGYSNMPAAKGLKGKLIADAVDGIKPGTSLEGTRNTRRGESLRSYVLRFSPTPSWKPGAYHIELRLMKDDGSEDLLKVQDITIR